MSAAQSPQVVILAVYTGDPVAPAVQTSQAFMLAVTETEPVLGPLTLQATTQAPLLVVYGSGETEGFQLRAWAFTLDGHHFYVLDIGTLGTFVYDTTTQQWAKWQTQGFAGWNAVNGTAWDGRIVAGDKAGPQIWLVDPESQLDEGFKPIRHASTAILPKRGRSYITMDALRITASVGYPEGTSPNMTVSISDDNGATYRVLTAVNVTLIDSTTQELAFRSLGAYSAPGRVVQVEDEGGPVRIDDADVDLTGE